MKTSEFKQVLERHPDHALSFVLPNGESIPPQAHITEAGRVDKTFLDCGGTFHKTSACLLQAWVADDTEHRLSAGKLAAIMIEAAPILREDDPAVEIEFEHQLISQFPILSASVGEDTIFFDLGSKHTDCLARATCLPDEASAGCCSSSECC